MNIIFLSSGYFPPTLVLAVCAENICWGSDPYLLGPLFQIGVE